MNSKDSIRPRNSRKSSSSTSTSVGASSPSRPRKKLLVLHGNRQTGQLLLGRMDKLRKKLLNQLNVQLIAPDAPFLYNDSECTTTTTTSSKDEAPLRTWWKRSNPNDPNYYEGLEESLRQVETIWNDSYDEPFEGILGFSQGARLAHLIATSTTSDDSDACRFRNLRYVILVASYDAPPPTNWEYGKRQDPMIRIPSLHVYGEKDQLITAELSRSVMQHYLNPSAHVHEGSHHVPMRAVNIEAYLRFIESARTKNRDTMSNVDVHSTKNSSEALPVQIANAPDEETAQAQQDEVEALQAIFPDEFRQVSVAAEAGDGSIQYQHPIEYEIALPASDEGTWPPHPLALRVRYPPNYPSEVGPNLSFSHDNNVMELSSAQLNACTRAMEEAAAAELGMPSVMSCVYAARDFFESGGMNRDIAAYTDAEVEEAVSRIDNHDVADEASGHESLIRTVSPERIKDCNRQGLEIARTVLSSSPSLAASNGGVWKYTIGLVGKPSAGKSTFFNAATAFARQRDDAENALGGATMAPHPFTTIDPNVGYCLVPAPEDSCPEEELEDSFSAACTHGRDSKGRRLIPVMLKDVAGLVPGAYQGRGRGNKFLNDLTDADVLIHVVDASGTADTEGNVIGLESEGGGSHPLNDLAWIHSELIEWIYSNLTRKWDSIRKRGRGKLSDMFSGYGQNQATTWNILSAVEKYMDTIEQRDHALDHLEEWDQGDVHRLVSAFLGVRFPMALSLNKYDLPSAKSNACDVQEALPVHGAHVGIPLSAQSEMEFVRHHLTHDQGDKSAGTIPSGVWQCLQSAITIREPVLVFPVSDMTNYAPLSAMFRFATQDASLPNAGMIRCLRAAGGCGPTLWDDGSGYATSLSAASNAPKPQRLRDVLVMKPGSTVEDVFVALKNLGALGGEFVRAEAAAKIGDKAKPVPKHELLGKHNRILKIMTNKRREWQNLKSTTS